MSFDKITFLETFQDLVDALFSVNAPLLVTLQGLIRNPGHLLRSYLAGQRKKYYRPVAFFILTTVVYILIRALIGFDPFRNEAFQVEEAVDSGTKLMEARNYMLLNINNFLFIFVFTLAVLSKLFFYRPYSLAEFIAIAFYLLGIYTLITTLNMFFIMFISDKMQLLGIAIMLLYFLFVMSSLMKKPLILILLKSIIVYFLAFFTYFIMAFGLSYLIVLFKAS